MKLPLLSLISIFAAHSIQAADHHDIVVYGGTSAGVIAAVQAKKMGKTAIIVCPDKHLGGLSSGGLGYTDTGKKEAIFATPGSAAGDGSDGHISAPSTGLIHDGKLYIAQVFEPFVLECDLSEATQATAAKADQVSP